MLYELQNNRGQLAKGCVGDASPLQSVINQIGLDAVRKSLGSNTALGFCDVHGHYTISVKVGEPTSALEHVGCQLCPPNPANGTSATDTELYINVDPYQALGTNPQQKIDTYEEDVRGNKTHVPPTVSPYQG